MKKVIFSILLCLVVFSCKQEPDKSETDGNHFESVFKVAGIGDSLKANSVSMIVRLEGIESVYLNKADSIVSVKPDQAVINRAAIKKEIEKCGVEIIKTY